MGQLFDRMGRVVRANLNSSQGDWAENYLSEGTALAAGGAVAGASLGKIGILAGGAGYSLGAVPLAAAGAVTGAALYEALRSVLEGDNSSAGAAAIGAATGAATSAAIGGVGVAVGGSAIGVGMASMAAGGAVVGLGLVGLNRLLQQDIDPEKMLDRAIERMEADWLKTNQAAIALEASRKRLRQQYHHAQREVDEWKQRAQLALQKDNDYLAQEALIRKQAQSKILNSLKAQLDQEPASVKTLQQNLSQLKAKISEAKTLRTRLKAELAVAKANGQLQTNGQLQPTVGRMGASSAMSAFERMEQQALQMEQRASQAAELAESDLESQFAMLEPGGSVDDELAAMKAQLIGSAPPAQAQLPGSAPSRTLPVDPIVDAELEALRSKLDQL